MGARNGLSVTSVTIQSAIVELPIASFGAALIGTLAILAWRVRESRRPVSLRSLIIPPLGIGTGFSMFVVSAFAFHGRGASGRSCSPLVFAHPLVSSPQLTIQDGLIMMRRSRWFLVVILGLAAVRLELWSLSQQHYFRPADRRTLLRTGLRNDRPMAYDPAARIPAPYRPLTTAH